LLLVLISQQLVLYSLYCYSSFDHRGRKFGLFCGVNRWHKNESKKLDFFGLFDPSS